jgi:hypothetical protein
LKLNVKLQTPRKTNFMHWKNKGLGYIVTYDLVSFLMKVYFLKRYTKYEEIEKGTQEAKME